MGAAASAGQVAAGIRACGTEYAAYADRALEGKVDGAALKTPAEALRQLGAEGEHSRVLKEKLKVERRAALKRARALQEASAIVDEDIKEYGLVWEHVRQGESEALQRLAAAVERVPLVSGCDRQPTLAQAPDTTNFEYLLELNEAFEDADDRLFEAAERLVEGLGLTFKRGPPKDMEKRAMEKARLSYDNDYSRLKDLRRASALCPTVADVVRVVDAVADGGLRVCRIKNRFSLDYDSLESAGYRDLQFNVVFANDDGASLVWELQVHLEGIEALKTKMRDASDGSGRTGHQRYVEFRKIKERLGNGPTVTSPTTPTRAATRRVDSTPVPGERAPEFVVEPTPPADLENDDTVSATRQGDTQSRDTHHRVEAQTLTLNEAVAAAERGDFRALVSHLGTGTADGKEIAAGTLIQSVNTCEKQVAIVKAGALEPLVDLLRTGTANGREKAAGALRKLASENNGNKVAIAKAGGIEPLVDLLRTGTADGKQYAAWALRELGFENDENKVAIANAGAIEPLVDLLQTGTAVGKEKAAAAVKNLAAIDGNKVAIARAGAIEPLVDLLRTGTADGKQHALGALMNLACNNDDNKVAIGTAGAFAPLVDLLRMATADGKEKAAEALALLACNDRHVVAITKAGAVEPLVDLLRTGTADGKAMAAWALREIALDTKGVGGVAIAKAGGIQPLVDLLRTGTAVGKEKAVKALRTLSLNDDNKVAIVKAGAIEPLVDLLRTGSANDKQYAAKTFACLAANVDIKVMIANAGAFEPLVDLLRTGTADCKEIAAWALRELVHKSNKHNKVALVKAGALEPLIDLLRTGFADGKRYAAGVLFCLSSDDTRLAIFRAGAIEPLFDLLRTGSGDGKDKARGALQSLSFNDDCRVIIAREMHMDADDASWTKVTNKLDKSYK